LKVEAGSEALSRGEALKDVAMIDASESTMRCAMFSMAKTRRRIRTAAAVSWPEPLGTLDGRQQLDRRHDLVAMTSSFSTLQRRPTMSSKELNILSNRLESSFISSFIGLHSVSFVFASWRIIVISTLQDSRTTSDCWRRRQVRWPH
jgi:hypothetical protein